MSALVGDAGDAQEPRRCAPTVEIEQAEAHPDRKPGHEPEREPVREPTDLGVANWVSTGGLNWGTVSIRLQDLDPWSGLSPWVNSQVVPLTWLRAALRTRPSG